LYPLKSSSRTIAAHGRLPGSFQFFSPHTGSHFRNTPVAGEFGSVGSKIQLSICNVSVEREANYANNLPIQVERSL
jgi:hypothetical protein